MTSKNILIFFLYIIGTIGGLYFSKSIIPLLCVMGCISILFFRKKKLAVFFIFIILVALVRANFTINYINDLYNNSTDNFIIGDITNIVENDYTKKITISVNKINGKRALVRTKIYVYVKKGKTEINLGDTILVNGKFTEFSYAKNTGNFNFKNYLLSKRICGLIKTDSVEIIRHDNVNIFNKLIYWTRASIRAQFEKYLPEKNAQLCCALILGEKENVDNYIIKSFSNAGISHIIAISGMHTAYIALFFLYITKKFGKKISYYCVICVLIIFCNVAHNSESVLRATIMIVLYYFSKLVHCKSDSFSNLLTSILINIMLNPFCIYSIGLVMSSAGTLGILKFYDEEYKKGERNTFKKIKNYIINQIKIAFSANLILFPIIAVFYNKLSLMFIINSSIVNFIVGILMPVLVFFSMFGLAPNFLPTFIHKFTGYLVNALSSCLIYGANFFEKIDILNFKIFTPSIITITVYYVILFFVYTLRKKENINKRKIRKIIKIIIGVYICICAITKIYIKCDNTLTIHFIDVGQGDSTFIKTPSGKKILIDGGGNENGEDTVGEKILIPYLLNKSIKKIDYIIISHFDTDHVGGIISVMDQLDVGTVVISKQIQDSENYERFKKIIKRKKTKVIIVKQGDRLEIENNLYFDILWPSPNHVINENILNNNSLVCNMHYKNFSMIFTGDIEKIAEQQIVDEYVNKSKLLHATVLKVGHHGSKTSSSQKFMEIVRPVYAVIGVGINNKFGHPSDEVIQRFKTMRYKSL